MNTVFVFLLVFGVPLTLTIWNIFELFKLLQHKSDKMCNKIIEIGAILLGWVYTFAYIFLLDVQFVSWDVPILEDMETYTMLAPEYFPTFCIVVGVALLSYLVARFVPLYRQPPLVSVLCLSGIYLGAAECVLWCIQTYHDPFYLIFPINILILLAKTVLILLFQRASAVQDNEGSQKLGRLSRFLCHSSHWPWLALLLTIPLLGLIIMVNRQLCVANAFEQLLEEHSPRAHRLLRGTYDKIGYPISKHIKSPYVADFIYFAMKPLEWLFTLTLYLVDVKPENRIARQYPHTKVPS